MKDDSVSAESEMQTLQKLMSDVRNELHEIRLTRGQISYAQSPSSFVHPENQESHEQLLSAFGKRIKILSERVAKRDLTYHAGRDIRDPAAIVRLMAPLSSEERLLILSSLDQQSLSFKDLENITGKLGGTLKHHLNQLEEARYIQQYKSRGRYSITLDGQLAFRLSVWLASCLSPDEK